MHVFAGNLGLRGSVAPTMAVEGCTDNRSLQVLLLCTSGHSGSSTMFQEGQIPLVQHTVN